MQTAFSSSQGLAHSSGELYTRSLPVRAAAIVSATLFIAVCAHISVPLPFTPVPLTMQDLAVLLVGLVLGPIDGMVALVLYLAEGAAGMPVFNPQGLGGMAQLLGPTGGFLLAYPLVAAVCGWGARHLPFKSAFARAVTGCVFASAVLFGFGATWLAQYTHASVNAVFQMAVYPFLPGNIVKVVAASGIYSSLSHWRRS